MKTLLVFLLGALVAVPLLSQAAPQKLQSGAIVGVVEHKASKAEPAEPRRFDVSVKVGNTIYVVLYTPPDGSTIVEYRVGAELPVSVGTKTIKFVDIQGGGHEVPILRRTSALAKN